MTAVDTSLPTLYEHYTSGGIASGLSANQSFFTLNDRNITVYSGAMHYFRVPRKYWKDRLRKMRAAGLNAVETYVPWNLHEPERGHFDFGAGGSDMEDFLHLEEFLKTAKEEDLLAIVRPGPFICSEWDFGGLPSWLLREKDIKVRTSDRTFMHYVKKYFNVLLPILAALQFTRGGPVIAVQVENEYGSTYQKGKFTPDKQYLRQLRQLMLDNGIVELLYTSDSSTGSGTRGTIPEYFLQTSNFASDPDAEFNRLNELQKNKPTMAMEFWTGWFDHWSETHHTRSNDDFYGVFERILKYPASVNMYMFHGGTSFGFLNGANIANGLSDNSGYQPDTTSYDYDAPLTENGDYTIKYVMVKELIKKYNSVQTRLVEAPAVTRRKKYASIGVEQQLLLSELIDKIPVKVQNPNPLPMELLPINNQSGQSYGYIVYRKTNLNIPAGGVLKISGHVCDTVTVLVNGVLVSKPLTQLKDLNSFGYWKRKDSSIVLTQKNLTAATLDLLVENWGRNNFGNLDQFKQLKGLWQGPLYLNGEEILDWEMVPLEFKKAWTQSLRGWHSPVVKINNTGPALYRMNLVVDVPTDTFVNMTRWIKGIVVVNGFVLGRYARIGPQQTLYLPAPLLKEGYNSILVFDHFDYSDAVEFSHMPVYKTAPEDLSDVLPDTLTFDDST